MLLKQVDSIFWKWLYLLRFLIVYQALFVYYTHIIFSHITKCSIAIPVIYSRGPTIVKLQIANVYSCDLEMSHQVVSYYLIDHLSCNLCCRIYCLFLLRCEMEVIASFVLFFHVKNTAHQAL